MIILLRRRFLAVCCTLVVLAVATFLFALPGPAVSAFGDTDREEPVIVIDPGHGGEDGGAVSISGVAESGLNLEISKRLEALFLLYGKKVAMTRESETIPYPPEADSVRARKSADTRARTAFIQSFDNALLISVHQNKFSDPAPHGAQVLFAPTQGSRELAEAMQALLISQLDSTNRRSAVPADSGLYILNHVSCPAVLVECGFLSNPNEEALLRNANYQTKLAAVIAAAILSSGGTS